jgi:Domain of unknown function (DUF4186)
MAEFKKPEPLKISCTSTDCTNNLHCFKAHRKMAAEDHGKCRECGADLIDWNRVHLRNIRDAKHTFAALKNELIRHHYFHRKIDAHAVAHAKRKGRVNLHEAVRERLSKHLAPAAPPRDGRQTPLEGNAIFYGQHATACCCRKCLEYWHAVPQGRELTQKELDYCVALIELYLKERLPDLKDEPVKVPPIRKAAKKKEGTNESSKTD